MNKNGFTLIELIVVIVILGIISVVAMPKFLNFQSNARISVLKQVSASVESANKLVNIKSYLPSFSSVVVNDRDDLIDVDLDDDGIFETRLKWRFLDNTDIEKRIIIDDSFVINSTGRHYTYIGYDFNQNGFPEDDNCYFEYKQAQSESIPPTYVIIDSGC